MFCDLVGSSALANRLELEVLREVVSLYYAAVARIMPRFKGFIARYLGDGALVYFGYPEAREDAATLAVRAGLAGPERLHVRVGIATGVVVIGELIGVGSEHEVVGEAPNLAARLQALAAPDTTVISGTTRGLVGHGFALEQLGSLQLRGWEAPVPIWRVTGENPSAVRFAPGHARLPLIGRDAELQHLTAAWQDCVRGAGRTVVLSGEAGMGKSHIVAAFCAELPAGGHRVLTFQCSPSHGKAALHPVLRQLESAAGFQPGEPAELRLNKLRGLLQRDADAAPDTIALFADLLALALPDSPAAPAGGLERKTRSFGALIRYLCEPADEPAFLLLEDAHWIDPTTLELFERIVGPAGSRPLLLIVTVRPDFAPFAEAQAGVTWISLGRLGRDMSGALICGVAGGRELPERVVEAIVEKADGIPLFLEELT